MKSKIVDRLMKDLQVSLAGIKEGVERIAEQADLKMKVAKLSLETAEVEKDLESDFRSLGELAYRDAISRPADFYDRPDVQDAMQRVRRQTDAIRGLERRIDRIRESRTEENLIEAAGYMKDADWSVECFQVVSGSAAVGKPLSDAQKPASILVVSIVRAGAFELPEGRTVLEAGDQVTVVVKKSERKRVEQWLSAA